MDQPDYPGAYPGYELQMQPSMVNKTHTLPHPHHHHNHQHIMHDKNRARDDQHLGYHGTMSGNTNFTTVFVFCHPYLLNVNIIQLI